MNKILPCLFLFLSTNAFATELQLNFEQGSVMPQLSDSDWVMLKESARETLTSGENKPHFWSNTETGNAGSITVLGDAAGEGICKQTQFVIYVGNNTVNSKLTLCQSEEGKWSEASERETTVTAPPSSPYSTQNQNTFSTEYESEGVTQKSLGSTSDYCRQLYQETEDLKGYPLRRSAAKERYEAECLR